MSNEDWRKQNRAKGATRTAPPIAQPRSSPGDSPNNQQIIEGISRELSQLAREQLSPESLPPPMPTANVSRRPPMTHTSLSHSFSNQTSQSFSTPTSPTTEKGFSMTVALLMLIGLALIVVPWILPPGILSMTAAVVVSGFGAVLVVVMTLMMLITRMYRKASANMAFVKTGMGGAKPILDGGAMVFPVVHQMVPVSLETMRLNVERRGPHALITKDNLRVDLSAEFYIKVQANKDDILQAARSLGGRSVQADAVSELVQEKLVSALRTVAATKDLVELHSKRDEFATAVQQIVTHDLSSNGLTLESVTISALDQTDPSQLQERNVFDAQGLRKIAEITQKARIERNEIEREAERAVVTKDVATRKLVLNLDRDRAEAEAEQKAKVATIQAMREREIAEFKLQQDEAVAKRGIEKTRAIEMAEVQRRLTVEQAEIEKMTSLVAKEREQREAEISKNQAVEVAERAQQVAVADKERELAAAKAAMLKAEAERTAADQNILTVKMTSEAQREAEKKLIAAKQIIMENKIREETNADVLAYMQVKEAEGQKQSAELQYEAKLRLADAEAASLTKRAEGDKAVKMVDVNVERERVSVESARVEVERISLSNRQEFDDAALKFEIEKLKIQADKEVRIAAAQAMANMFGRAQMQIFGDPTTMAQMSAQFMKAAGYGAATDGFMQSLPPEAKAMLEQIGKSVASSMGGTNGKTKTAPVVDATVEATVKRVDTEETPDAKHR